MSENTENKTLLCSHSATRFLYQVEVKSIGGILLEGVQIGREWEPAPRRNETFRMNCHNDCAADIDNGLFPYALAMSRAWGMQPTALRRSRHWRPNRERATHS
jgi:hypothetical protein